MWPKRAAEHLCVMVVLGADPNNHVTNGCCNVWPCSAFQASFSGVRKLFLDSLAWLCGCNPGFKNNNNRKKVDIEE